tara:strand:- start:311 stop:811 length:501 start_codon:yes stop_codon:yes gene_type:complete
MENTLFSGDPMNPEDADMIVQSDHLQTGKPVPDGWRVMSGSAEWSLIMRVAYRYEIETEAETTDAYDRGFDRGQSVASWVDIPDIGTKLPPDVDWVGVETILTEADQIEAMELLAGASETNDRDFSPFELTASEFNKSENADEIWLAFDNGIAAGIRDNIAKRFAV